MKKEKWYYLVLNYFKQNKITNIIILFFVVIFTVIFSLYELEKEALFYALALCSLFILIVFFIDFCVYLKDYKRRLRIIKNINVMIEELPTPKTLAEKDFEEMLIEQNKLLNSCLTNWHTERNESIDYYTTWVHQIKTPISVMQLILQSKDSEDYRELSFELFRIEQYVEMVLTYLRLESDTSDYIFKECDLDSIIRQVIHKYAPQFVRKKISLKYNPISTKIVTDEKWMTFIIEQVLSNSIKYTNKGSVSIEILPQNILKISDTGIGIAKEDIPRIFEKGFTGYNGHFDKKATGLGLYLCKMAADNLSVKISADSIPGKGTTIYIDYNNEKLKVE